MNDRVMRLEIVKMILWQDYRRSGREISRSLRRSGSKEGQCERLGADDDATKGCASLGPHPSVLANGEQTGMQGFGRTML